MTTPTGAVDIVVLPVADQDFAAWSLLWASYNAFYGREGPRVRSTWLITEQDSDDEEPLKALHIAFSVERPLLDGLLWRALGTDIGIRPCPRLRAVCFMSLKQQVLVHPHDDRGMDVVGSNHALLARLYARYGRYLLDYDRKIMASTFEA